MRYASQTAVFLVAWAAFASELRASTPACSSVLTRFRAQEPEYSHPQEEPSQEEEEEPGVWFRRPNIGYGPFPMVSLSPFQSLRSGFAPRFPSSLSSDRFEFRVGESWAKNLASDTQWQIDFDLLRSNLAFSWGLSDAFRLDIEVDSGMRTGSQLEAFILGFHQLFGLALASRKQFARDDFRFEFDPPGGGPRIVVDKDDPQPYTQSAIFTLQHTFTHGDEWTPAVSYALSLRTELAPGDLRGGSPVDLNFSIGLSKEYQTVFFYLGANFAWFGQDEFFGQKLRTTQWSVEGAVEWNVVPRFSIVGQLLVTASVVDRFEDFSRPSNEITAGFKWEASAGVLVELAIIENVINFQNSPDFGVHMGLALRW